MLIFINITVVLKILLQSKVWDINNLNTNYRAYIKVSKCTFEYVYTIFHCCNKSHSMYRKQCSRLFFANSAYARRNINITFTCTV